MSLVESNDLWRYKVMMHKDDWMEVPGRYEICQQIGYALSQSIQKYEKVSSDKRLPTKWTGLMYVQGETYPWKVFCAVKRLSAHWHPLQAKMPNGERIAEALIRELLWMRNRFAVSLIEDAVGTDKKGSLILIGNLMIAYLRAVSDIVQTYLRDEQEFVWSE